MQNPDKRTPRSSTRGRGVAYTLAGVAAVGAVWLGIAGGSAAENRASTAGTQAPSVQQTSKAQVSSAPDSSAVDSSAVAPDASAPEVSADGGSPGSPTESAPAAEPTADGGADRESSNPAAPVQEPEAETAVQRFVDTTAALNAVSADAAESAELGALADGAALEELQVQGDEMAVNRWSLDGEAEVDGVEILGDPSSSDVLQVQACVDSSDVALKDENGALIQAKEPAGTRRSLNLYDLEVRDGAWTVVNHYFPDNADC